MSNDWDIGDLQRRVRRIEENLTPPRDRGDGFLPNLGTMRACLGCGCVVSGGPTRCVRCVVEGPPRESIWRRLRRLLSRTP